MLKRSLFYILTFTIPLLFFFLLVEIITPKVIKIPHVIYRSWGNRPGTYYPNTTLRAITKNYDISFKVNALGFNDVNHNSSKDSSSFRVLLLGDSYIEGETVLPEKHMARVIERLARNDHKDVEVIVMGMSGYGQAHQLATYERLGKKFDPDLVITFFCSNDMWNNRLDENNSWENGPMYIQENEKLVLRLPEEEIKIPLWKSLIRNIIYRFEAYHYYRHVRALLRQKYFVSEEEKNAALLAAKGKFSNPAPDSDNSRQPASEHERKLFRKLVKKFNEDVVHRDGNQLLGAIVSSTIHMTPSVEYFSFLDYVEEVFHSEGVEVINFDRLFRKKFKKTGILPCWKTDCHWNEIGHQWVAEELYRYIN